jgi:hypothetical protein
MGNLIPRADDYGSHPEATRAILEACRVGWVKNVSVLVVAPRAAEAARELARYPHVCVGLHFSLSAEWQHERCSPASGARALCDEEGSFPPEPSVLHERKLGADILVAEVRAQFELASRIGLDVRYLDEHMGCGWIGVNPTGTKLADVIREECARRGVIYHTDRCSSYIGAELGPAEYAKQVASSSTDVLLVTHPAYDEGSIAADRFRHVPDERGREAKLRRRDLDLLLDPALPRELAKLGIELLRYDEVR